MSGGRAADVLRRAVPWLAIVTMALWAPLVVPWNHSWDDADPEVLNDAYRLARGLPTYGGLDGPPWNVNPYTPLYVAIVAGGLELTGLSYTPARLASLLAAAGLLAALVVVARRSGSGAREGLWAAAFLILVPSVLYNAARPNPQMLAVACAVWSFVLFEDPRPWLADRLSPLMAVLAVYTKQTAIVLPVALCAWLAWKEPRRLPRYLGAVALLGLAPLPWLESATGGGFLRSVLSLSVLPYDVREIVPVFLHFAGILLPFIALAIARLVRRADEPVGLEPIDAYYALLVPATIATLGRAGAHTQYVLELLVVTVIYLMRTGGLRFPQRWQALTAVQLALVLAYGPAFVLFEEGPGDRARLAAAPEVRALLAAAPGPVLSQQGSFPLFTRGEIHVQLFHFTLLAAQGRWDERPLLREVEQQQLAWVVTEAPLEGALDDPDARERFTPLLHDALARNYVRRAQIGPYYVYQPRSPRAPERVGAAG
jgi:hypothetical protein